MAVVTHSFSLGFAPLIKREIMRAIGRVVFRMT
jgi:hypothetical protein